jgi:hypothetical protein
MATLRSSIDGGEASYGLLEVLRSLSMKRARAMVVGNGGCAQTRVAVAESSSETIHGDLGLVAGQEAY